MNNNEKYKYKIELKKDWPFILIIVFMFIIGILVYDNLPERIIVHWNIQGQPDDYMNKPVGTFLFPVVTLGVYLLIIFTPLLDPRSENYNKFIKAYRFIRYGLILFFAALYIVTILVNLGYNLNIGKLVSLGVGMIFIIIGNFMPQLRHNYFVGIKVPWTLADEEVWRKTHRLAGKVFFLSGIIIILSVFLPPQIRFWLIIGLVIATTAICMIYSFLIYNNKRDQ